MAKQNELKNLVRGKGIEVLGFSSEGEVPAQEEIVVAGRSKPKDGEKLVEPKFEIKAIAPSEDDLRIIQATIGDKENYLLAWAVSISEGESLESNFGVGKPISFKINCAASELLVQLGARCRVEIIAFDARSLRPEKLYCRTEDLQLMAAYFQIACTTEARLEGLFKLNVILSVPKTALFQVYECGYFQVS